MRNFLDASGSKMVRDGIVFLLIPSWRMWVKLGRSGNARKSTNEVVTPLRRELFSGAATYVLHTSRDPQRPYNEQSENPKNIRTNIQENPYGLALSIVLWSCLFSLKQESPALTSISSCWDYCLWGFVFARSETPPTRVWKLCRAMPVAVRRASCPWATSANT